MPHLHTAEGQHDFTASAFIVRTDFDRPRLMLHRHKKLKVLLQFGGHVELDQNPWEAVTDEVRQESGYEMTQLKLLQPKDRYDNLPGRGVLHPQTLYTNTHPIDTPDLAGKSHYHIDMGWAFVANEPPSFEPEEGESSEIIYVDAEELAALDESEIWPGVRDISKFVLEHCLTHWERISL